MIRRSPVRRPGTFATGATASSADLARELVRALQDPDALVTVDVVAMPDPLSSVVLYAADPALAAPDMRLRAEHKRAGTAIAQATEPAPRRSPRTGGTAPHADESRC